MKKYYQVLAATCLFLTLISTVNAEETKTTQTAPMGGMGMGMHHGMGGGMMGMTEEEKDKHMRSMQEHMLKMHDLSNQILAEKDATKKEQLKTEQLKLMKEHHAKHHAEMMEHRMKMKHNPKQ